MVCPFVAILELTRLKEIVILQHRHFEDIEVITITRVKQNTCWLKIR